MTSPTLPAVLRAFRGALPPRSHDSRALSLATGNPGCRAVPVIGALGQTPDRIADLAHDLKLGPGSERGMSQIARQQGDTFDEAMLGDGEKLLAVLEKDGWVPHRSATVSIPVINVDDHVAPPTRRELTADGGKNSEKIAKLAALRRVRFVNGELLKALTRTVPTVLLHVTLETSSLAATPVRCFGEADFVIVYPPGVLPPRAEIAAEVIAGTDRLLPPGAPLDNPHGLIVVGDAKSWRKLRRLDNGDKRATVAVQLAVYVTAMRDTWPPLLGAAAVSATGLIANPPATGGLAKAVLTRVDMHDALRALAATTAAATDTVDDVEPILAAAVAAGATLDATDPDDARAAVHVLLDLANWGPECLPLCPLARTCRRHVEATRSLNRFGPVAAAASPVTTVGRLNELLAGAAAPTPEEGPVVAALQAARATLGPARQLRRRSA